MITSARTSNSARSANTLTGLAYKNFKAFSELELETRPITVLLGPNNSGKSSILAGPKLLTQTTESFDSNVSLLLNGFFGDYGTYRDVVFKNHRARAFEIKLDLIHRREIYTLNAKDERRSSPIVASTLRLKYRYRSKLKQIVLSEIEITSEGVCLLKTKYSDVSERALVTHLAGATIRPSYRASLSRRLRLQNFLPLNTMLLFHNELSKKMFGSSGERLMRDLRRAGSAFHRFFDELEYVGAIRAAPARSFLFSGETRGRVGSTGEHAINMMMMDSLRSETKSRGIQKRVTTWLQRAGVAGDLQIRSLSDRYYEVYLRHPTTGEFSNFADVGYGNSQVIPVLVAGFNLHAGGTLLVEQPEIHLHPRAQAELGSFFKDLYERGVQSFVETHSEHLVLRLQQYVAQGTIPAKDIVFYYIYAKGTRKRAARMTLDNEGRFIGEWPEGFFPERLEEAKKLAKARITVS